MLTVRQKFSQLFEENMERGIEVQKRKAAGYTSGTDDNFSNFRFAALMATLPGHEPVTVEQTILSRMADKISRYKSLIVRPEAAYDESVEDTLHDLMVYSNILLTWEQMGRPAWNATYYDDTDIAVAPDVMTQTPPTTGKLAQLFNWGKQQMSPSQELVTK